LNSYSLTTFIQKWLSTLFNYYRVVEKVVVVKLLLK